MRNFLMNIRRYKALILAVLPFLIAGTLLLLMNTASSEGWDKLGYLLLLLYSFPILVTMSALSAVFAFNGRDLGRKYVRTTKVMSLVSLLVFGGVMLLGVYGALQSILF